ncbi:MAG: SSI family serine proteinase inhibitor [Streptosporangiaceae bacterium]
MAVKAALLWRTRMPRPLLAVAAAGIVAAGCGTAAGPGPAGGSGGAGSGGVSNPVAAKVTLRFAVRTTPGAAPARWLLRCDPAGGTVSDPAAACARLLKLGKPFAPPPQNQVCPQVMASSGVVSVTGTWFGQRVHRRVVDGTCDLGLYATLHAVLR